MGLQHDIQVRGAVAHYWIPEERPATALLTAWRTRSPMHYESSNAPSEVSLTPFGFRAI